MNPLLEEVRMWAQKVAPNSRSHDGTCGLHMSVKGLRVKYGFRNILGYTPSELLVWKRVDDMRSQVAAGMDARIYLCSLVAEGSLERMGVRR